MLAVDPAEDRPLGVLGCLAARRLAAPASSAASRAAFFWLSSSAVWMARSCWASRSSPMILRWSAAVTRRYWRRTIMSSPWLRARLLSIELLPPWT